VDQYHAKPQGARQPDSAHAFSPAMVSIERYTDDGRVKLTLFGCAYNIPHACVAADTSSSVGSCDGAVCEAWAW
jgi:hypothetical protein